MIMLLNTIICFVIATRLFLFKRCEKSYKFIYAILAWLLICSSASVAVFILFHEIEQAQTAQTLMNFIILICVLKTNGNMAQFIRSLFISSKEKAVQITNDKKVKQS